MLAVPACIPCVCVPGVLGRRETCGWAVPCVLLVVLAPTLVLLVLLLELLVLVTAQLVLVLSRSGVVWALLICVRVWAAIVLGVVELALSVMRYRTRVYVWHDGSDESNGLRHVNRK